jgi:hypothetical protein
MIAQVHDRVLQPCSASLGYSSKRTLTRGADSCRSPRASTLRGNLLRDAK